MRDHEIADEPARVDVEAEPVEKDAGAAVECRPGDDARQFPQEYVLGDRQVGRERRLLVDHRDAVRGRDPGVVPRDQRAVDQDRSSVGRNLAGQHPHQRRLAGAVLAQQRMDLARLEIEVDAPQRPDAAERPGDALQFDERAHAAMLRRGGVRTLRLA